MPEIKKVSVLLADTLIKNPVMAFYGELGSGKTTLIKEICTCLGVEEKVSSPSFGIMNEYKSMNGKSVYHFDFYRIRNSIELSEMGAEDILFSGNICLIEWPQMAENHLPDKLIKVFINRISDSFREYKITEG